MHRVLLPFALGACLAAPASMAADPAPPGESGDARVLSAVSSIDDLDFPWIRPDEDRLAVERGVAWEQLVRYGQCAQEVAIGRVLATTPEPSGAEMVLLEVEEGLRGDPDRIVEFRVPPSERLDDMEMIRPPVVPGYRVLVYLDAARSLVDGNAMYFVEGGHVWRNKRLAVFLRPGADRVWIDNIDPSANYVVFSLDEVRQALRTHSARKRNRLFRRG